MVTRRLTVAAVAAGLLVAACGSNPDRVGVAAQSAPTTTAPTTTTTTPTSTTGATTAPPKEAPLPDGALHGDQPEVVQHFNDIDNTADCDQLAAEQAARQADRDQMLATRQETGHRSRAELDDRYAETAHRRMADNGCYLIAHTE